ncbi:MAG: hypothetical protein GY882_01905 [Actinomycetia bacterium]|nr:hypothetical protein [Actinomycetes bacterium]MCP4845037.1 hypothetical protein [Actinomycetes bacterium]
MSQQMPLKLRFKSEPIPEDEAPAESVEEEAAVEADDTPPPPPTKQIVGLSAKWFCLVAGVLALVVVMAMRSQTSGSADIRPAAAGTDKVVADAGGNEVAVGTADAVPTTTVAATDEVVEGALEWYGEFGSFSGYATGSDRCNGTSCVIATGDRGLVVTLAEDGCTLVELLAGMAGTERLDPTGTMCRPSTLERVRVAFDREAEAPSTTERGALAVRTEGVTKTLKRWARAHMVDGAPSFADIASADVDTDAVHLLEVLPSGKAIRIEVHAGAACERVLVFAGPDAEEVPATGCEA